MPSAEKTTEPVRVAHCKRHRDHHAGCPDCRAYSTYMWRRRQWDHANGIDHTRIPADALREHVEKLRETMPAQVIADRSGVCLTRVRAILRGGASTVTPITAECLLALQPARTVIPPKGLHPNLEVVRILRGLHAQGWNWRHIGDLLGLHRSNVRVMADPNQAGVRQNTIDRARALARQLGPYDINLLPKPMPGMAAHASERAARYGWPTLSRWAGRDLTDPDAQPQQPAVPIDDEPSFGFVDPVLISRIKAVIQKVHLETADDSGRNHFMWIPPITALTRLGIHIAWWMGETAGLNDRQIALMVGYPMNNIAEIDAGMRQMNRLREKTVEARAWIDSDPAGETPTWYTPTPPARSRKFNWYLPALLAMQEPPIGVGWTIAELAKRCGLTEDEMITYLAVASREGDRPARRLTRRHAAPSTLTA